LTPITAVKQRRPPSSLSSPQFPAVAREKYGLRGRRRWQKFENGSPSPGFDLFDLTDSLDKFVINESGVRRLAVLYFEFRIPLNNCLQ